jgi:hypothetical protein
LAAGPCDHSITPPMWITGRFDWFFRSGTATDTHYVRLLRGAGIVRAAGDMVCSVLLGQPRRGPSYPRRGARDIGCDLRRAHVSRRDHRSGGSLPLGATANAPARAVDSRLRLFNQKRRPARGRARGAPGGATAVVWLWRWDHLSAQSRLLPCCGPAEVRCCSWRPRPARATRLRGLQAATRLRAAVRDCRRAGRSVSLTPKYDGGETAFRPGGPGFRGCDWC